MKDRQQIVRRKIAQIESQLNTSQMPYMFLPGERVVTCDGLFGMVVDIDEENPFNRIIDVSTGPNIQLATFSVFELQRETMMAR